MRLIGIVIALVLAVAAGYIFLTVSQPDNPAPTVQHDPQPVPTQQATQSVDVLVASQPIRIGEVLKPEMISRQPWPSHLLLDGFVTAGQDSANVVGMVTRATFQEGEPLILAKLSNPSDPNFLAAALDAGYKVSTIQVDNISAIAGFIFPGDYVDVLITHDLPVGVSDSGAEKKESFTELLLTNVKVLAVDDRSTAGAAQPDGQKRPPSSVSLEVTLEQAQKLRLGQETGYVSLALRSLKDKDVDDTTSPTAISDLTKTSDDMKPMGADMGPVRVIRGTEEEEKKRSMVPGMSAMGSIAPALSSATK